MGVLVTIVVYISVLAIIFGFLCSITGEKSKGDSIINYCFTALILLAVVVISFMGINIGEGIFSHSLPLLAGINEYGSVSDFFQNSPGQFALSFVELVTLVILINWVSNLLSFSEGGLVGKMVSKLIIFFIACLGYGIVMNYIGNNTLIKWFVYVVECVITGSAILYTPALILSTYLNIKEGTFLSTYILSILPETNIGKAISASITTAISFIIILVVIEQQSGSIINTLNDSLVAVKSFGGIVIMIFGLYFIVKSITK